MRTSYSTRLPSVRHLFPLSAALHANQRHASCWKPNVADDDKMRCCLRPCSAKEVQQILADERASLMPSSSTFWVLVAALRRYIAEEGRGSLPLEVPALSNALQQGSSGLRSWLLRSDVVGKG